MADFFFKANRTETYLLALPSKYRFFITFFALAILAVCWFLFIHQPLQLSLYYYEQKYKELVALQESSLKKKKLQHNLEKAYLHDTALLAQEKDSYTKDCTSLHHVVTHIFTYAHNAQILLNKHIPLEVYDHEWYSSHYFNNEFQGSFAVVVGFLKTLKNNPYGIILQKLIITKNNDQLKLDCMFIHNQLNEGTNEKS